MALETANYVGGLVATNPTAADPKSQGDDHLRLIKAALLNTFAGFSGMVIVTGTEAQGATANDYVVTVSPAPAAYTAGFFVAFKATHTNAGAVTVQVNALAAKALKAVDGVALGAGAIPTGAVVVAFYDGTDFFLISASDRAPVNSPAFTGTPTAPTPALSDNSTKLATTAFCVQLAFQAALPAQPGTSAPLFLQTLNGIASWAVSGIGSVATVSSATDVTLTASSAGYQSIAMTAMGKHVTLPDATTMTVGGPRFILKNDGGYPFGIRDAAGVLVMAVAAGGIAYVTLKDAGSAAGSWSVIGDNLEPGLITIDNTFSSTYASTVLKPFVALDDNKSIHFCINTTGSSLYAFAVDKVTKTVGIPVLVTNTTSARCISAFKVSSTSAILFHSSGDGTNTIGTIISLSSNTSLSVSGSGGLLPAGSLGAEDFSGAPKIAQLTPTLYLASYTSGTNTSVVAVSVSGTTVTIGSAANIITANSVANSTTTYRLTDTTALVIYLSGASADYAVNAVVVSVSSTTCTVGTPASKSAAMFDAGAPSSCLLSATKAIVYSGLGAGSFLAYAVTVSGTSVSIGATLTLEGSGYGTGCALYTGSNATRYNPHLFPLDSSKVLLQYRDSGGDSRAVVLTESGGTVTAGTIMYGSISNNSAATAAGYGLAVGFGQDHFISLVNRTAVTSGSCQDHALVTCKISGTAITQGSSLSGVSPNCAVTGVSVAKVGSKYAITGGNTGGVAPVHTEIPVFSSNGDCIKYHGAIRCPAIEHTGIYNSAVSTSRLVILGSTPLDWANSSGTYKLRLLNVEIAQ